MITQLARKIESPTYQLPRWLAIRVIGSVLFLRRRSIAQDSQKAAKGIQPPPTLQGLEHIPQEGPCLVVCNHYSRPGFAAWWLVLGISAIVAAYRHPPADPMIHWVITNAWTFPKSRWRHQVLTPLSRWAFTRVATIYDFISMPPMPPNPADTVARVVAVRGTLRLAHRLVSTGGMLGLAPEGMDHTRGLGPLPSGAGGFIALLVEAGLPILPVGVSEKNGCMFISFGPLFIPQIPSTRAERDLVVGDQILAAIARQLI